MTSTKRSDAISPRAALVRVGVRDNKKSERRLVRPTWHNWPRSSRGPGVTVRAGDFETPTKPLAHCFKPPGSIGDQNHCQSCTWNFPLSWHITHTASRRSSIVGSAASGCYVCLFLFLFYSGAIDNHAPTQRLRCSVQPMLNPRPKPSRRSARPPKI